MHRNSITLTLLFAAAALSSCNPFKTDLKEALVGRWESAMWSKHDKPLFAEFAADGSIRSTGNYNTDEGKWLLLDSGELEIRSSAEERRCKPTLEGKKLTLTPPTCMLGWDKVGPSIDLMKQ